MRKSRRPTRITSGQGGAEVPAQSSRRLIPLEWLLLAFVLGFALLVRTLPLWTVTMTGDRVLFHGVDAWYHVRHAENIAAHLPLVSTHDSYLGRDGAPVPVAPLTAFVIALPARVVASATLDAVAAWLPPLAALLCIVAIFVLARRRLGAFGAITVAALTAVLPGQFLQRSVIGYTDQHVLECLFVIVILTLISRQSAQVAEHSDVQVAEHSDVQVAAGMPPHEVPQPSNTQVAEHWDVRPAAGIPHTPPHLPILTALALTLYTLSWSSAFLGITILALAWFVGRSASGLRPAGRSVVITFAICSAIVVPLAALLPVLRVSALAVAAITAAAAILHRTRSVRRGALIITTCAIAASCAALALPSLRSGISSITNRFLVQGGGRFVLETRSLLEGDVLATLWREYALTWLVAIAGAVVLARNIWRGKQAEDVAVMVWSAATTLLVIYQIRFSYYHSLTIALLCGHALAALHRRSRSAAAILALLMIIPAAGLAARSAGYSTAPSTAWVEAMDWLRESSPAPFAEGSRYTALERVPGSPASYTVMTWWDEGYVVSRIAQRVPVAVPTQSGAGDAARYFLETSETAAAQRLAKADARYVVTSASLAVVQPSEGRTATAGAMEAMAAWSGRPAAEYYELVEYTGPSGVTRMVYVFHPAYFQTMGIRLQQFGGRAVRAVAPWVMTFVEERGHKRITSLQQFASYDAARAFAASMPASRRVVSVDPRVSCIPLAAVTHLRPVYVSSDIAADSGGRPAVTIFERTDAQ